MKGILKIIVAIIIILIVAVLGFAATQNVLIIAEDTTEGTPGVDMAAIWNISSGFTWIYPGSSLNAEGQTLHNIHLNDPDDPYPAAKEIIEYTYNTSPSLIVTVNNAAAERIFGGDIVSDIRDYDWGQGMSRGDAVDQAMGDFGIDYLGVLLSVLTGDIKFHFV